MNKEAVLKARGKLDKMRRALEALKAANENKDAPAADDAWADFIIAASTFYSALEQGSKANGRSKGWFGRKKHERRTDELLGYLHHARDAEHHGLKRITGRTNSHISVGPGAAVMLRADGKNTWNVVGSSGEITYPNDLAKLIAVVDDRFGDVFNPPTKHLGVEIKNDTPTNIATLGLAYLEGMLVEAEGLSQ